MKNIIVFGLSILICLSASSCITIQSGTGENKVSTISGLGNCDNSPQNKTTKTEYQKDKIEGIKVSNGIILKIIKGGNSKADIIAGNRDISKVVIDNNQGVLTIKIKDQSCVTSAINIELSTRDENIIKLIEGTGASSIIVEDGLISPNSLTTSISGASKLGVTASDGITNLNSEVTGTSKQSISTKNIDKLVIDASGAAFSFIQSDKINSADLEASGASSISTTSVNKAVVNASGASTITLKKSNIVSSKATGASTIIND